MAKWIGCALSLAGLAISLWAHADSLLGHDPRAAFPAIWAIQLILFALIIPIALRLIADRSLSRLSRAPRWAKITETALVTYYGLHFYIFMLVAGDHLSNVVTWRMFSSGWILMFAFSAIFYAARINPTHQSAIGYTPQVKEHRADREYRRHS